MVPDCMHPSQVMGGKKGTHGSAKSMACAWKGKWFEGKGFDLCLPAFGVERKGKRGSLIVIDRTRGGRATKRK